MKRRIALSAFVIFAVFFFVVEALGNLTWHLSPRDSAAMEEAYRAPRVVHYCIITKQFANDA